MQSTDYGLQQATEKATYKKQIDAALASVMEGNQEASANYNDRSAHIEMAAHRALSALQHGKIVEAEKILINAICGG